MKNEEFAAALDAYAGQMLILLFLIYLYFIYLSYCYPYLFKLLLSFTVLIDATNKAINSLQSSAILLNSVSDRNDVS